MRMVKQGIFSRIVKRRSELQARFAASPMFDALQESCVPSYIHRNAMSAAVAWWRLAVAVRLYHVHCLAGPILDFGASTGEIWHILEVDEAYDFVELNGFLVSALLEMNSGATRRSVETLPAHHYAAIFALDSLEHNKDVAPFLEAFKHALAPGGVLIISGPTENWLYRIGRRISGFDGHYHVSDIYDIERMACDYFKLVTRQRIPLGMPLFNISVWRLNECSDPSSRSLHNGGRSAAIRGDELSSDEPGTRVELIGDAV
jgi:SAM-dependent methyltransferase